MPVLLNANSSLKKISNSVKNEAVPLSKINIKQFEGIQNGIPLFDNVKLKDIAFVTNKLETVNFFRGCTVGCTHCLKNANSDKKNLKSVLFEDIIRFADGFKELSERFGFNVFNGVKYLSIIDDANPSDFPIKGLNSNHSVAEGMKILYEKLEIPLLYVTSGWNKDSKFAQKSAEEVNNLIVNNQNSGKIEVSINPFSKIMEDSRIALKNNDEDKSNYLRNIYISKMVNTLKTFLNLFKLDKAQIIYRYAPNYAGNELVNSIETEKLYRDIYRELTKEVGSDLNNIIQLNPDIVTKPNPFHFIEPTGRGRKYFPYDINMKVQNGLIEDYLQLNRLSNQELETLLEKGSLKCVDINGKIYTSKPSEHTYHINSPIELTIPTKIQLNYINKNLNVDNVFSDIDIT